MGDVAYLARGMYRNRALLNLAHGIEHCQNCGAYAPEGCEPAHSNLQEHGRGKDNKSHDCYFAALCHACHTWLDAAMRGTDPSRVYSPDREGKREMFVRAMHRTWLTLWQSASLGAM